MTEPLDAPKRKTLLPGSVIISRVSGGDDARSIRITVEDESSHCRVLEIGMSLEQFALALTASYGKAMIQHFPDSPVGKKHEHKEEIVPFDWFKDKGKEAKILKPYEVDGWRGDSSDLHNHHRRAGDKGQRVVFHRYVENV